MPSLSDSQAGRTTGAWPRRIGLWAAWLGAVVGIVVTLVALTGAVRVFHIPTRSMEPTIPEDSYLTCIRYRPAPGDLSPGDIVVFQPPVLTFQWPRGEPTMFVQRVVALPGDRVHIEGGEMHCNGQPFPSHNGHPCPAPDPSVPTVRGKKPSFPLVVPNEHVFLSGDNNQNCYDSRYFGPIPVDSIAYRPLRDPTTGR